MQRPRGRNKLGYRQRTERETVGLEQGEKSGRHSLDSRVGRSRELCLFWVCRGAAGSEGFEQESDMVCFMFSRITLVHCMDTSLRSSKNKSREIS